MLALDVPQRNVDAAKRLDHQPFLSMVAKVGINLLPELLRMKGILPKQPARHGVDNRRSHLGGPITFSPARQPAVGFDLD
jgi:hypothetical protein